MHLSWLVINLVPIYHDLYLQEILYVCSIDYSSTNRFSKIEERWMPRGWRRFCSPFYCHAYALCSLQTVVRSCLLHPYHSFCTFFERKFVMRWSAATAGDVGIPAAAGGLRRLPDGEKSNKIHIILCVKSHCYGPVKTCYCCNTLVNVTCYTDQQYCWSVCPSRLQGMIPAPAPAPLPSPTGRRGRFSRASTSPTSNNNSWNYVMPDSVSVGWWYICSNFICNNNGREHFWDSDSELVSIKDLLRS